MKHELRVLELYSGIGGMHFALKLSGIEGKVVAAVDISPLANSLYKYNFPATNHLEKGVEGLRVKEIDQMRADMLLMSPPCQPFTRVGLKKDILDPRTKSFLYLLDLLPRLETPPRYILLENVKGFELSEAHRQLQSVLSAMGYTTQGFLLSPTQLRIPNSRLRYYLLAKMRPLAFPTSWHNPARVLDFFPQLQFSSKFDRATRELFRQSPAEDVVAGEIVTSHDAAEDHDVIECEPLSNYLEHETEISCTIGVDAVTRYGDIMDVVTSRSRRSNCFTKAYARYHEGTGSVLARDDVIDDVTSLRYFSPREVANLMCFPRGDDFRFPQLMTSRQRYRLLGNSLNVHVVAHLIRTLVGGDEPV